MKTRWTARAAAIVAMTILVGPVLSSSAQTVAERKPPKAGPIRPQGKDDGTQEIARKPPKSPPIGPTVLPAIERSAAGDGGSKPTGSTTEHGKPAAKPTLAAAPATASPAQNLDTSQPTRIDGCVSAMPGGGWMLKTGPARDAKTVLLIGDEDIAHHGGEYVQVKGGYVGEQGGDRKDTSTGEKKIDTFDVDDIQAVSPSCPAS